MILSGLGCRLQTCSCLATEWFNSTFRAGVSIPFCSLQPTFLCKDDQLGVDLPKATTILIYSPFAVTFFFLPEISDQIHLKNGFKLVSAILGCFCVFLLSFLQRFAHPVICSLMYLVTHALINHIFVHLITPAQPCLCVGAVLGIQL